MVHGTEILVCTPYSRLHKQGNGLTLPLSNLQMLDKDTNSILAFRVGGNEAYYFHFRDIKPYLTKEAMVYNKREGDHWKLYIWLNYIQVLGSSNLFRIKPNDLEQLTVH